jgi:hypothetical protein
MNVLSLDSCINVIGFGGIKMFQEIKEILSFVIINEDFN